MSVNGEDVQILLNNGAYMAARLERDVQIALGQMLNFQVQSNKDNKKKKRAVQIPLGATEIKNDAVSKELANADKELLELENAVIEYSQKTASYKKIQSGLS